jgi:3-dehydroquinate dehydratase/shikimate dehydrogenase
MEIQPPAICVSICEENLSSFEQAILNARPHANVIELRLDCLNPHQIGGDFRKLDTLIADSPIPIIVTYRPAEQGGRRALDSKTRLMFWLFNRPSDQTFLDMEFDIARNPHVFEYGRKPDWSRVICSHHDFVGMPKDLEQLYAGMAKTPAHILKIAVQADDAIDCVPVFRLLERARADGRQVIAIAMGEAGLATRILGPSRGAFLTYAALDDRSANAPGQPTVDDLHNLYRIQKINRQTHVMGLVGMPVTHSVSPAMHNAAFESSAVNAVYIPFPVRDIASFMRRMVHPRTREIDLNIRGLSVTAPHKGAVMSHLDRIDLAASEIGAVNTIVAEDDELVGYNTDASAFIQTLSQRIGDLQGTHCAVIGAGGSAAAVVWALKRAGAAVTVLARDKNKAASFAQRFNVNRKLLSESSPGSFEVVINTTPLGTSGSLEDQTPATAEQLRGARVVCDLVYNPLETRFLREGRAAGCETIGGLPMLATQAVEQFRLWTGVDASEDLVRQVAEKAIKSRSVNDRK